MNNSDHPLSAKLAELETYRRVFYSSPDFISISRFEDGLYIDVNPGYERLSGYSRSEVVGRLSMEVGIWPSPAERRRLIEALGLTGEVHDFPAFLKNRKGDLKSVEISASTATVNGEKSWWWWSGT